MMGKELNTFDENNVQDKVVKIREGEYDLLSVKEAGKMLGVNHNRVYAMINSGEIPYITGFGGKKIRKGALYDLIMQNEHREKAQ